MRPTKRSQFVAESVESRRFLLTSSFRCSIAKGLPRECSTWNIVMILEVSG